MIIEGFSCSERFCVRMHAEGCHEGGMGSRIHLPPLVGRCYSPLVLQAPRPASPKQHASCAPRSEGFSKLCGDTTAPLSGFGRRCQLCWPWIATPCLGNEVRMTMTAAAPPMPGMTPRSPCCGRAGADRSTKVVTDQAGSWFDIVSQPDVGQPLRRVWAGWSILQPRAAGAGSLCACREEEECGCEAFCVSSFERIQNTHAMRRWR